MLLFSSKTIKPVWAVAIIDHTPWPAQLILNTLGALDDNILATVIGQVSYLEGWWSVEQMFFEHYVNIYILYTLRWNTCAKLASRVLRAWGQGNENEMETTTKEIAWE